MKNNDTANKVVVLGKTFNSDEERRSYFREELRKKLPELKKMEGFPIGDDEDILNLSDAPYYTACPNPWLNDFISEWEDEKNELVKQGKRIDNFEVNERLLLLAFRPKGPATKDFCLVKLPTDFFRFREKDCP